MTISEKIEKAAELIISACNETGCSIHVYCNVDGYSVNMFLPDEEDGTSEMISVNNEIGYASVSKFSEHNGLIDREKIEIADAMKMMEKNYALDRK